MIGNEYKNVGKNIKALRKAYGETITDLAFSLGLDSVSTITNWEKGIRIPQRDMLLKIAEHYRITVSELRDSDFSRLDIVNLSIDDEVVLTQVAKKVLPIMYSEDSYKKDCYFKKGYDLHIQLWQDMANGIAIDDRHELVLECYAKSSDENNTPESLANILWWLLFFGIGATQYKLMEGYKEISTRKISKEVFLKDYWLKDCSEELDLYDENLEEYKNEYLNECEELIIELITELKRTKYVDLAEYYSALRYIFCLVKNNKRPMENKSFGEDLILELVQTGNKYAIDFLRIIKE